MNYDQTSFRWLEQNYVRIYGLRNWTWESIINGVIKEHLRYLNDEGNESYGDPKYIPLIWKMVMKLSGIEDLKRVPKLTDAESVDVKVILMMYSLESFLFRRLNQSSRAQDTDVISTLGPFAVALTKIINHV